MELKDMIGVGKKNAVTLLQLQWRTGMTERGVRRQIEELRRRGLLINNDQDGKGYYYATEMEEVAKQYRQDRNRFLAICMRIKAERMVLREAGLLDEEKGSPEYEQMSLFDSPLTTT